MLQDSGVQHGHRRNDESEGDTRNGAEFDVILLQQGIDEAVHDGCEEQDCNWVEVLHQVVGDTVKTHLSSLRDEVTGELRVYEPVDWIEEEHFTGDQRTLQLFDEKIIPWKWSIATKTSLVRGLWCIHIAVLDHHANCLEGVGDDGTLWWSDDVELLAKDDGDKPNNHHAETHQVRRPESNVLFHIWCSNQGKRAEVDTAVEHQVDSLDCHSWINNDALTGFCDCLDCHLLSRVLICDQRRNVRFDTTGSNSDNQNSRNKSPHSRAVVERYWQSSDPQDEKTNDVDAGGPDNCPVFSDILI